MIYHFNRKSIADCLLKYILQESSEICQDLPANHENETKYKLLQKILDSFDPEQEEKCLNICEFFEEGLGNNSNSGRRFLHHILKNENLVKKILDLSYHNINTTVGKEVVKILTKFTEAIIREIKIKVKEINGTVEGK